MVSLAAISDKLRTRGYVNCKSSRIQTDTLLPYRQYSRRFCLHYRNRGLGAAFDYFTRQGVGQPPAHPILRLHLHRHCRLLCYSHHHEVSVTFIFFLTEMKTATDDHSFPLLVGKLATALTSLSELSAWVC
jgi:hypothetical protein